MFWSTKYSYKAGDIFATKQDSQVTYVFANSLVVKKVPAGMRVEIAAISSKGATCITEEGNYGFIPTGLLTSILGEK